MAPKVLLCNCARSQTIDRDGIAAATGLDCSAVQSGLCTHQLDIAAAAMQDGPVVIACEQEAAVFEALADDLDADPPHLVDIRDRAGWAENGAEAGPKMAALLAAALLPRPPAKTKDIASEGLCLILGAAPVALPAARQLADVLSVTCLLPEPTDDADMLDRRFDIHLGRLAKAHGALGGFQVSIDGFPPARSLRARGHLFRPQGRRGIGLRPHPRPDRRHAALPGPAQTRGLSARRSRRSAGRGPRHLRRRTADRHVRETALHPLRRKPLRPFPRAKVGLHPLPRPLPQPAPSRLPVTMSGSMRTSARAAVPAPPSAPRAPPAMTIRTRAMSSASSRPWPRPTARRAVPRRACWSTTRTMAAR